MVLTSAALRKEPAGFRPSLLRWFYTSTANNLWPRKALYRMNSKGHFKAVLTKYVEPGSRDLTSKHSTPCFIKTLNQSELSPPPFGRLSSRGSDGQSFSVDTSPLFLPRRPGRKGLEWAPLPERPELPKKGKLIQLRESAASLKSKASKGYGNAH